jgi:hypothetical protein
MARSKLTKLQMADTLLGYVEISSNFSTASTTPVQVTGLTLTVTIPAGGAKVEVSVWAIDEYQTSAGATVRTSLWDGTVGSGTMLGISPGTGLANDGRNVNIRAVRTYSAGSKTFNVGFQTGGGTGNLEANTNYRAFLMVEIKSQP